MAEAPKRSINEVNRLVKSLVEQETIGYPFWVGGYVSRHYVSNFGHEYFDINDEEYSINCFVRNTVRGTLDFEIANGLDLEIYGSLHVYERMARVQVEVEFARLVGDSRFVMDTTVQEQLAQRGLWPPVKKPLPDIVTRLGIVTSKQSDALHDFEDTYLKERGTATRKVVDVLLQGQQAPQQIADAIQRLNRERQVDVIVVTRGGGRSSDLAVFNDILVAEAIARSEIPVVTGIGHQRDDTLADQVADLHTITPTAAALALAKHSPAPPPQPELQPVTGGNRQALIIGAAIVIAAIILALVILSQSAL